MARTQVVRNCLSYNCCRISIDTDDYTAVVGPGLLWCNVSVMNVVASQQRDTLLCKTLDSEERLKDRER